jgi:hypothetical protein
VKSHPPSQRIINQNYWTPLQIYDEEPLEEPVFYYFLRRIFLILFTTKPFFSEKKDLQT